MASSPLSAMDVLTLSGRNLQFTNGFTEEMVFGSSATLQPSIGVMCRRWGERRASSLKGVPQSPRQLRDYLWGLSLSNPMNRCNEPRVQRGVCGALGQRVKQLTTTDYTKQESCTLYVTRKYKLHNTDGLHPNCPILQKENCFNNYSV